MKLLALDTTMDACSVALQVGEAISESWCLAPRKHSQILLRQIELELANAGLERSQLDGIVCTQGPGSFTGVRLGLSVAQGIAYALDLPIALVSSLATIAENELSLQMSEMAIVAIDARMNDAYFAVYQRDQAGDLQTLFADALLSEANLPMLPKETALGLGNAWSQWPRLREKYRPGTLREGALPHAKASLRVGQRLLQQGLGTPAEQASPIYLRQKVADKP